MFIHLSYKKNEKMKASLVRLGLGCSQYTSISMMDMSISNGVAVALAQVLHHNSTLKKLNLSNNNINDAGAVSLAQALHHNSTLEWLDLSNNNVTVNTSIYKTTPYGSGGLRLPSRCEEYATQCTQYNTVKNRIAFW